MKAKTINIKNYLTCLVALLCLNCTLLSIPSSAQMTLYSQAPDPLATAGFWTSSTFNYTQGYATYDDFVLPNTSYVTQVSWRGLYIDASNLNNNPISANTISWRILIDPSVTIGGIPYPTANGRYDVTLPTASVAKTLVGTSTYFGHIVNVYDFTANLPIAFTATAGVRYWISPVSIQPDNSTIFSWLSGRSIGSGFNSSQQYSWVASGLDSYAGQRNNEAFSVRGIIVTPPSNNKAVLLVHGTFSNAQTWISDLQGHFHSDYMAPTLERAGFHTEAVDFTQEVETLSNVARIEDQAMAISRRLVEVSSRAGVEKVSVVCHSMGGLAARYYLEHPELWQMTDHQGHPTSGVDKLIMLGTPNWGTDSFLLDPVGSIAVARSMGGDWSTASRQGVDLYTHWSPGVMEQFAEWQPGPTVANGYPSVFLLGKWKPWGGAFISPIQGISYVLAELFKKSLPPNSDDVNEINRTENNFPKSNARYLYQLSALYYLTNSHNLGVRTKPSGIEGLNYRFVSPFLIDLNSLKDHPLPLNLQVYIAAGDLGAFYSAWNSVLFGHQVALDIDGPFNSDTAKGGLVNDGVVPLMSVKGIDPMTNEPLFPNAVFMQFHTYHANLTTNSDIIGQVVQWLSQ